MNEILITSEYVKKSVKLTKITPIGKSTVYDIEVEDEHKLLANGFYTSNCSHPDIEEFITVKSDYTKIQNANISVHITNDFYKAVKNDKQWTLKFEIPGYKKGDKVYIDKYSALIDSGLYYKDDKGYYYLSPKDRPYEKFEKTISAKKLFRLIAENMWKNAEPGIQNIDIAREYSNSDALYDPASPYDTRITSTNACSEQYLSRDSLCFLASIIASKFSTNPEEFDKEFSIISPSINRFLDNSISYELEHNRYATPLQKLANEQLRRTGAGVTDVGGWLFKQNLEYDSEQGSDSLELFIKTYNYYLYKSTIELGKEKGNFDAFDKDKIKNSKFIRRMMKEFPDLDFEYMRNVTVSSIAPTGTLTLMARIMLMAYGLEPSFGLYYWKRTRISGKYEYYFIVPNVVREYFKEHGVEIPINSDTIKDTWDGKFGKPIADFIDANKDKLNIKFKYPREIDPIKKMDLMAKVMKWVDSSISITYMLPEDTSIEKVEEFIMRGWEKGVKSIAAFPDMKMYGIISYSPFKDLAVKLKSEGMDIHPQNFSDDELKEMNIEKQNVVFSSAPKRPQKLPADIYIVTVKGEKFIVAVGKLNNVPYEMFAGHLNGFNFKFKEKQGYIEKIKKGQYRLIIGEDIEVDDFAEKFTPIEKALFRQVSTNLRHGTPLKYIVDQLQKSSDDMFSVSAASARVLKKYIKDGEYVTGKACPSCGSTNLIYEEGCVKCTSCSWSKCE